MAQAMVETIFDAVYLCTVITLGVLMLRGAGVNRQFTLFGLMAVLLGCGDAFHLVPRAFALCTTGLEAHAAALGVGKFITSIIANCSYRPVHLPGINTLCFHLCLALHSLYVRCQSRPNRPTPQDHRLKIFSSPRR